MNILVIQTAFIGDVILATPVIEYLHRQHPEANLDFLVRKGNESLFRGHPFLHKVITRDKKRSLFTVIKEIRRAKYAMVINVHRFASSGLITLLSGAEIKVGFDKNPFSFCYTKKVKHIIGDGRHEVDRNMELAGAQNYASLRRPHLYPTPEDYNFVNDYKSVPYICIAPASVWFTKQFPAHKWVEFTRLVVSGQWPVANNKPLKIYLLGSEGDAGLCHQIQSQIDVEKLLPVNCQLLTVAGKLTLLQSAALMKDAMMNYCNDSAPLHIASAVNAPVTAIFCSTVPAFGFGPLSDNSTVIETKEPLPCKPCGLHGYMACPMKHFKCAETIPVEKLLTVNC